MANQCAFLLLLFYLCCQASHSWNLPSKKLWFPQAFSFLRFIFKRGSAPSFTTVPLEFLEADEIIHLQLRWDCYFQNLALKEAQSASHRGEVPVGAVVVEHYLVQNNNKHDDDIQNFTFRVLAQAGNQVEALHDASAHAELIAMRQAASRLGNWRLTNCTLYSTLEPCHVCFAAAHAFRIRRIVYGAPDYRLGAIERRWSHQNHNHFQATTAATLSTDQMQHPFHTIPNITAGVYANESSQLLQAFFRAKRKQATAERAKKAMKKS